jgi:pimeloyl-ACP methyl ester carboxylesterase
MLKSRMWRYAVVVGVMLALAGRGQAGNETIGVVLMHGKWGSPAQWVPDLARALEREGYLVISPEMPWSGRRLYDKSIDDAMAEIDGAVKQLRDKGARTILVAGHSLGAAATVRYGTRTVVDGLIVLAPGHFPEGRTFRNQVASSVRKAREMVEAGKGDDRAWFDDLNTGARSKSVRVTGKTYLDYFDPDGPMNFRENVASLRAGVPILWVVGTAEEEGLRRVGDQSYQKIPSHPGNKYVEVRSDHLHTPGNATEAVISWIKAVTRPAQTWRSFGSSRSRTQSPRMFSESTVTRMAMPGRIETHHACSISPRPSATITPHDGVGGGIPTPRKESAASRTMT